MYCSKSHRDSFCRCVRGVKSARQCFTPFALALLNESFTDPTRTKPDHDYSIMPRIKDAPDNLTPPHMDLYPRSQLLQHQKITNYCEARPKPGSEHSWYMWPLSSLGVRQLTVYNGSSGPIAMLCNCRITCLGMTEGYTATRQRSSLCFAVYEYRQDEGGIHLVLAYISATCFWSNASIVSIQS